jgi:tetratricopeptide (TPR) repeat protein
VHQPIAVRLSTALLTVLLAACGPGTAGDRAWERGDHAEAARAYRDLPELTVERRMRLARALAGEGDLEAAAAELVVVPEESWTPDGHMAQGLLLLSRGLPAEAALSFAVGARMGGDAALKVNHCGALLAAGAPDASVCADALVAAPQDPAAMLGLAAASLAEENPVVTQRTLSNLLAMPTLEPRQVLEAARLQLAMGDASSACASFERAGGGGLEGARACATAGQRERAQAILEPLVEQPEAAFMLGTMALERALEVGSQAERQRAIADAWRRFRACEGAYAQLAAWHNNVGRLHALDSEEQPAELAFRRAMVLDPHDPYPVLNLARLLEARGDAVESGALLERVAAMGGLTAAIAGLDLARRAQAAGEIGLGLERAGAVLSSCEGEQAGACVVESCVVLATMLAARDPEQAVALAERAVEIGGAGVVARLRAEPELEVLRERERYAALVGGSR